MAAPGTPHLMARLAMMQLLAGPEALRERLADRMAHCVGELAAHGVIDLTCFNLARLALASPWLYSTCIPEGPQDEPAALRLVGECIALAAGGGESRRRAAAACIMCALAAHTPDMARCVAVARPLEESCFDCVAAAAAAATPSVARFWTNAEFTAMYVERCACVLAALGRVDGLCDDLLSGRVGCAAVGRTTERAFNPDALRAETAAIALRRATDCSVRTSAEYPCTRADCGARSCTWNTAQRRSLDEPETVECVCTVCGTVYTSET
jgi:DNA-directed RNA polymerase subunit M/transcription elongation factor TFIIS